MSKPSEMYDEVTDMLAKARAGGFDVDSDAEWHQRTGKRDSLNMLAEIRERLRKLLEIE